MLCARVEKLLAVPRAGMLTNKPRPITNKAIAEGFLGIRRISGFNPRAFFKKFPTDEEIENRFHFQYAAKNCQAVSFH